jgi:hypothetical protein
MKSENTYPSMDLMKFVSLIGEIKDLHDDAVSDGAELEFLCAVSNAVGIVASKMANPHRQLGQAFIWVAEGFGAEDTRADAGDEKGDY